MEVHKLKLTEYSEARKEAMKEIEQDKARYKYKTLDRWK